MTDQYINIDLIPGSVNPVVHVSQYDKVIRTLRFSLFAGGLQTIVPEGAMVNIVGHKPDGNIFSVPCAFSGSVASVDVHEQMTAVAGKTTCEIQIVTSEGQIGSANFVLDVELSPYNTGETSESVIDGIEGAIRAATADIIESTTEAAASAGESAEAAEASETKAKESELLAKQYAEEAGRFTPEGYFELVDDVEALKSDVQEKIDDPTSKSDGQVLTYNATSEAWEAKDSEAKGTVKITQAEYDDLTEDEKNNGCIYVITDADNVRYLYGENITDAANIAYDDSETALGADNVSGAISVLNSNISEVKSDVNAMKKNIVGNRVDLLPYTSNNPYFCPSDGYVFLYNSGDISAYACINGTSVNIGGSKGRFSTYVRKGTRVWKEGTPTILAFCPLE